MKTNTTALLLFFFAIQGNSNSLGNIVVRLEPTEPDISGTRNVSASVSATGSVDQSEIPGGVPLITFPNLVGGTDNRAFSSNLGFGQSEGDFPFGESLQLANNVLLRQFHFVPGTNSNPAIVVRMQNLTGGSPNPIPYNTNSDTVLLANLNYADLSPGTYVSSAGSAVAFGGLSLEIAALPLTLTLSPGAVVGGVTTTKAQFTQGNAAVPQSVFGGDPAFLQMTGFDGNPFEPTTDPDTGQTVIGFGGTAGDRDRTGGDTFFDLGSGLEVSQLQFDAVIGDGDGLLLRHSNNTTDDPFRLDPDTDQMWSLLNLPYDQLNPGTYEATGGDAAAVGGFRLVIQPVAVPEPSAFLCVGSVAIIACRRLRQR